jgi:hypothetical protein
MLHGHRLLRVRKLRSLVLGSPWVSLLKCDRAFTAGLALEDAAQMRRERSLGILAQRFLTMFLDGPVRLYASC